MINRHSIQPSHVLYRVNDLHKAVKQLQNEGFVVEYGTKPEKAYNALIWFEEGIFIEIYNHSGINKPIKWLMKFFGYQSILERIEKWEKIEGWCEWSLETTEHNLNNEKKLMKEYHQLFKFHKANRKDINEQTLRWDLLIPNDVTFPFLMSSYVPNPRPKQINHPNGIKAVSHLIIGKENLNMFLLNNLLLDQRELMLIDGKEGLQSVEFVNSTLKIEDILI